jgi:hypothetical protein
MIFLYFSFYLLKTEVVILNGLKLKLKIKKFNVTNYCEFLIAFSTDFMG